LPRVSRLLLAPIFFLPPIFLFQENKDAEPGWERVLERAIDAQGGRGLSADIREVDGRFDVVSYDEGHRIEAKVRQSWRRAPEGGEDRFRSEVTEQGAGEWSIKGFDGKNYWLRDAKRTLLLRGRDYRRDREQIEKDRETLRNTIDFFFLEGLRRKGASFREVADAEADVVGLERTREGERTMRLFFDRNDFRLVRVVLLPWEADARTVTFRLSGRCRRVSRGGKPLEPLHVPQSIKVFFNDESRPNTDTFIQEIRINPGLPEGFFDVQE